MSLPIVTRKLGEVGILVLVAPVVSSGTSDALWDTDGLSRPSPTPSP